MLTLTIPDSWIPAVVATLVVIRLAWWFAGKIDTVERHHD